MTDPTPSVPTTNSSPQPLSSREYIEQMRQRRQSRRVESTAVAAPEPPQPTSPATTYIAHPQEAVSTTPQQVQQPQQSIPPQPAQFSNPSNYANDQTNQANQENYFPAFSKPIPEETIMEWHAASRPFKKRDRQYYTTIAAIVFLVSLILFFAGQFLPIAVVISVGFLAYVLSSVPPDQLKHTITTYGVHLDTAFYSWDEMGRFWFEEKYGQPIMHIEIARFPNRLTLVLGEAKAEELRAIISEVLLEQKPQPTFFDKAALWLQEKIPLEVSNK